MKLLLNGWEFEGEYREKISPQLLGVLENIFPSTDGRNLQIMANVRKGDGINFGQVPDLLDKFKVPHEVV